MNQKNTRVLIVSCEEGPDAWYHESQMLRDAFPRNDPSLRLVSRAEEADIIFIADLHDRHDDYKSLRQNVYVQKYPERCFVVGEDDKPPRWVRGIQTSMTRSVFNFRRFHSGAYALFHPDFLNQYVIAAAKNLANLRPEKKYFFAFTGRACIPLRKRLFATHFSRPDILVKDTSSFNAFTHDSAGKDASARAYAEGMLASKFALCPRGIGAASIRLFEAMSLGIAPIIVSDNWMLPHGPAWNEFALFVREDQLDQIEPLAVAHEHEWQERGRKARAAYDQFFSTETYVLYLIRAAQDIIDRQVLPEKWTHALWPLAITIGRARRRLTRLRKQMARKKVQPGVENQLA